MFKQSLFSIIFSSLFLAAFTTFNVVKANELISNSQEQKGWYQLTFENDALSLFNKSDDGYSNGIKYAWGRVDYQDFDALNLPRWIAYLSDWTYINQGNNKNYSISYGVSQGMYTPDELEISELIEDDRPYAGTLLWHAKIRNYGNNRANSLGLALGVAGPASLAEQSQTIIHKVIDATTPEGWDNQINNEPVFRIEGEHIERFYDYKFSNNLEFDTSSYSELGVGNLRSDVGTGLTIRLGNMLEQTYSSINPNSSGVLTSISNSSKNKFYWQLFTSAFASYVFNDITLNGNTFSDSHSVDLVNEQILVSFGASVMYYNWGAVLSIHRGNDQFEGQENVSKFGSITVSYHY